MLNNLEHVRNRTNHLILAASLSRRVAPLLRDTRDCVTLTESAQGQKASNFNRSE